MARILIIDDDLAIRILLRQMLENAGHEVHEAKDGEVGISLYQEKPFDMIITDILMPEKDGMEVIVELVENFRNVKILAISAGGRGLDADFNLNMARDFGACHALAKPFTKHDLLAAVDKALATDCAVE